jgi:flagellar biosynthesis/type III secretory pathway protein FliH
MVERLQAHLVDRTYVTVRANDGFGPYDCCLLTPQGRVVANLDVQLDALSSRWGVTDMEA